MRFSLFNQVAGKLCLYIRLQSNLSHTLILTSRCQAVTAYAGLSLDDKAIQKKKIQRMDSAAENILIKKKKEKSYDITENSIMYHNDPEYHKENSLLSTQEDELDRLDILSLASLIQNDMIPEDILNRAVEHILDMINHEDDRAIALQTLIEIKDFVEAENQQSVLKELNQLADIGGNEAIVDSFFNAEPDISDINRLRMLTYLDPKYPLGEESVMQLETMYMDGQNQELGPAILNTLAESCGEKGVSWIAEKIYAEPDIDKQNLLIDALGRSKSELTDNYLHKLLDDFNETNYGTEESKEHLRQLIRQPHG